MLPMELTMGMETPLTPVGTLGAKCETASGVFKVMLLPFTAVMVAVSA